MRRSATGLVAMATTVGMSLAMLLVGTAWADKPATVPRTGGIPACEASLAEANASLNQCTTDLGTCDSDLATCNDDLGTCEADLAACEASQGGLPGDGAGNGPGTLDYQDCGDGTVADLNTGLLWERKVAGGGGSATCLTNLHGVESRCNWTQATGDWIDAVNAEGGTGYAGFDDWRVPNVKELQSIVDYGTFDPAINAGFPGETASSIYWSATSSAFDPGFAWVVVFSDGFVGNDFESNPRRVRAVRSGPCSTP